MLLPFHTSQYFLNSEKQQLSLRVRYCSTKSGSPLKMTKLCVYQAIFTISTHINSFGWNISFKHLSFQVCYHISRSHRLRFPQDGVFHILLSLSILAKGSREAIKNRDDWQDVCVFVLAVAAVVVVAAAVVFLLLLLWLSLSLFLQILVLPLSKKYQKAMYSVDIWSDLIMTWLFFFTTKLPATREATKKPDPFGASDAHQELEVSTVDRVTILEGDLVNKTLEGGLEM